MRKRDLLKHLPGFSKLLKTLDALESSNHQLKTSNQQLNISNQQLKRMLQQLVVGEVASQVEAESSGRAEAGGLPVPAAIFRFLVGGTDDLNWFLHSGRLGAQTLVEVLGRHGKALADCTKILDFGCGCGRVLRHLKDTGPQLCGTDCNASAVQWCRNHLAFACVDSNGLEPPLRYGDEAFDLVYAFSILTHLPGPLQARWMTEFRRILRPQGHLVITVHGDHCARQLPPAERAEYDRGNLVVCSQEVAGSNECGAFHPESYVRGVLANGFDVLDFIRQGAKGNPPQDLYLLKPKA